MTLPTRGIDEYFSAAPLVQDGWQIALEQLARQTNSARAQVIGFGGPAQIAFNHITNLGDPSHFDEFVEIGGGRPDVSFRVALADAPFVVTSEDDYATIRNERRFDIYNDFAAKWDMPFGVQTVLANEAAGFLGLATLRTASDGVSATDDRAAFAAAAPAVLRAIRLQQAIEHQGAQLLSGAFSAMRAAALLIGSAGTITASTPAADAHLSAQAAISARAGMTRAIDRTSDQRPAASARARRSGAFAAWQLHGEIMARMPG